MKSVEFMKQITIDCMREVEKWDGIVKLAKANSKTIEYLLASGDAEVCYGRQIRLWSSAYLIVDESINSDIIVPIKCEYEKIEYDVGEFIKMQKVKYGQNNLLSI